MVYTFDHFVTSKTRTERQLRFYSLPAGLFAYDFSIFRPGIKLVLPNKTDRQRLRTGLKTSFLYDFFLLYDVRSRAKFPADIACLKNCGAVCRDSHSIRDASAFSAHPAAFDPAVDTGVSGLCKAEMSARTGLYTEAVFTVCADAAHGHKEPFADRYQTQRIYHARKNRGGKKAPQIH